MLAARMCSIRYINIILRYSAGGGGAKSDHRKAKIQAKNEKLNDERQRKALEAKKVQNKHDHDKRSARKGPTGANAVGGGDAAPAPAADEDKFAGVHPSRRGQLW